jgi:Animal haem peroxidase
MAASDKALIRPYAPAAADRYCRLFAEASAETQQKMTAEALGKLAQSMRGDETPIPSDCQQGHAPPAAAVTYFGQFVDHDLTLDSTPLREAGCCEPEYTINHRTPWLDLDHLYGDGPLSSRHHHLYESDDASFRIGHSPWGGEPFDVPFTYDGRLALVDERNGENIILRQIHAMFLKLHNAAVRDLPTTLPPCERFDRARDRVRWQYQWLVRNWYLPQICHPDVYDAVINRGDRRIDWGDDGFAIPVEFSVAAMRFGHSMVRPGYQLQEDGAFFPLPELFGGQNNRPLEPKLKIDWLFFVGEDITASAAEIDTTISEPLFELPDEHIDLYVRTPIPHPPPALALRTLKRGAAMRLPTGQQVRDALVEADIPAPTPEYKDDPWQPLRDRDLHKDTPLWYYILLEAQLEPGLPPTPSHPWISGFGTTLGKLGSRLVAEVIEASLRLDPASFVRQKEGATLEPWTNPNDPDGAKIQVKSLQDVALAAGLVRPSP